MKIYKATTGRELSRTTEIACIGLGIALVVLSIIQKSIYAALIGIVLLAAGAMTKSTYVSEEGIVTEYRFFTRRKREVWAWEDIMEIFCEYSPKDPGKVGIHFTKENLMARRLLFQRNLREEIIDLALSQNPKIKVDDD